MATNTPSPWGPQRRPLLTLEQAWNCIARETGPLPTEKVALSSALGRVLAEPILASVDQPDFAKAMMDGFAVRAADCAKPGVALNIVGIVTAGEAPPAPLKAGGAIRINTGAPLPAGADAVIPIESVEIADNQVRISNSVRSGMNVLRRGSHARHGDIILAPPVTIQAAQIALLAANGDATVEVYPAVSVGIVTTGNELVTAGQPRAPGHIFESNGPTLAALARQFGASPDVVGIARDDEAALREKFARAMRHPVVLAAGGMSMGTLDLVPKVVADLGVEWKFHGVQMRPGKPVAYGRGPNGQHVFGLPGNPVSVFVCAWLFVRMTIRGLQGHACAPPTTWRATLTRALPAARDTRPAYLPAHVWSDPEQGMLADPCGWGGSSDVFGAALGNALLVRTNPAEPHDAGDCVMVILTSTEF
ncbi:MAG TPA: gephyrin-like molybdotransferase Glp [Phycisphaerae bacterium]|nr:gephyrin-like molybdotransferase Glp [Phycisphaerae bacterium]